MSRNVRARRDAKPVLAYADASGAIRVDENSAPLADGGDIREPLPTELIRAPRGTVPTLLPGREPKTRNGRGRGRTALSALLPAGYTRLLLPAYDTSAQAPPLPLFGYTFACWRHDELYVAAMHTDQREDWAPRNFADGELETAIERRMAHDPDNRILQQLAVCSREYGCFTAQNNFLTCGEAAVPVSPRCNATCVGCISEQAPEAGFPSPQARIRGEVSVEEIVRLAEHHFAHVPDGVVSFGQGCEGEPLLRSTTIAAAIAQIRAKSASGLLNCNTNGSRPTDLRRLIDAGLQAVRISLNSFRPSVYRDYYRPNGYTLDDVLESIRLAGAAGLHVSLNLLTHPGVTDDAAEMAATAEFLRDVPVQLVQTRTLNIDPERYFALVGRPIAPQGMRAALTALRAYGSDIGNFTRLKQG